MFNKLFSNVSGLASFTQIVSWIQNLITHLETDAKSGKNEAIDAIVEVLQAAKTKPTTTLTAPVSSTSTTPPVA